MLNSKTQFKFKNLTQITKFHPYVTQVKKFNFNSELIQNSIIKSHRKCKYKNSNKKCQIIFLH